MGFGRLFLLGGVVIWPLLGASLLVVTLILERTRFWLQIAKKQPQVVRQCLDLYRQEPQAAIALLKKHPYLPMSRIFLAALSLEQATPEEFRLALESAAQAELPLLKRFHTVFETVVGVAPLLGLLGTILGLIGALSSLQIGDIGSERAAGVTAGIGEALYSTAFGLIVAMLTLLFANLFQGLYRRQRAAIEEYGGRLEILYRRYYRRHSPYDRG
ncbi:MAG: MotA/TolQ/ExbB proton channel family protein [Leptolyngbya sp. SIO4C1]|nr:MotA/TolQ/ExbB proton channel family protein [Leptolyngbya sp. SIO4C1]